MPSSAFLTSVPRQLGTNAARRTCLSAGEGAQLSPTPSQKRNSCGKGGPGSARGGEAVSGKGAVFSSKLVGAGLNSPSSSQLPSLAVLMKGAHPGNPPLPRTPNNTLHLPTSCGSAASAARPLLRSVSFAQQHPALPLDFSVMIKTRPRLFPSLFAAATQRHSRPKPPKAQPAFIFNPPGPGQPLSPAEQPQPCRPWPARDGSPSPGMSRVGMSRALVPFPSPGAAERTWPG